MINSINSLHKRVSEAVAHYWKTRQTQAKQQEISGKADQGARSAVTGGAQMDGFIQLISQLVIEAGINPKNIFFKRALELPGFFRPTKEWDFLVVKNDQLIIALEAKSQVGPSFGNNFNNRTEEAIGSAVDMWTAYREGAFNKTVKPWLGYIFLLEDCEASQKPVRVKEPHFKVFPEFVDASYAKRYEHFCRKLVRERHYNIASFLLSDRKLGLKGRYQEPADDLTFELFARSLVAQASIYGD
ncbi:MAG: PaeR7I family type II restriction endonuclease [Candidatus Aminicenantes bacterium]|nr:MAG: PaeR7I family type II restriction endonuclease [Candidatus Aminicenantes bacterium]